MELRQQVIDYLASKGGKGNNSWKDIALKFDLPTDKASLTRLSDWWRYYIKTGKSLPTEQEKLSQEVPEGMEIKSMWQSAGGDWLVSYKKSNNPELVQENILEQLRESLTESLVPYVWKVSEENNCKALFVYTSDKHLGAHTKSDALYDNVYNAKEFHNRMNQVFDEILEQVHDYGKFDHIFIFDLGDPLDGYNGATVRGGHHLPQNMDNKEQFDVYVKEHRRFFDSLVMAQAAENYSFIAVSDDNHSGDFGYCANKALEMYLNIKYPQINTHVTEKFMDYLVYGDHTIIYSHGKDKHEMSRGFPLHLNDKTEKYINEFIDVMNLSGNITFVKGDTHQSASQRAKRFRYKCVSSMYGASKWIMANFGKTQAALDYDIIHKHSSRVMECRMEFQ